MDLNGKCVLLGVSGGIAAYKMANVASALRKLGADVEVIMTKNATQFITPLTFETLTGHKCMVDTFDRDFKFEVTHISLAKKADVILVAPATANVIAKMAHGIADDMLTTVVLAAKCPKLVAPAMNTGMLENPITQDNLATLERYGFTVIPSESGVLACKDVGSGRLPKEEVLLEHILHTIARPKDLAAVRAAAVPTTPAPMIHSPTPWMTAWHGPQITPKMPARMMDVNPSRWARTAARRRSRGTPADGCRGSGCRAAPPRCR